MERLFLSFKLLVTVLCVPTVFFYDGKKKNTKKELCCVNNE